MSVTVGHGRCLTVVAFAARSWWVFDILTSYRPQYALVLTIAVVALAALRCWRTLIVAVLALGLNVGLVAPVFTGHQARRRPGSPTLTIAHLNLQSRTGDLPAMDQWLGPSPPTSWCFCTRPGPHRRRPARRAQAVPDDLPGRAPASAATGRHPLRPDLARGDRADRPAATCTAGRADVAGPARPLPSTITAHLGAPSRSPRWAPTRCRRAPATARPCATSRARRASPTGCGPAPRPASPSATSTSPTTRPSFQHLLHRPTPRRRSSASASRPRGPTSSDRPASPSTSPSTSGAITAVAPPPRARASAPSTAPLHRSRYDASPSG